MGLGRALKIMFTNQVKCDNCGGVIVDGTHEKNPRYFQDGMGNLKTDKMGNYIKLSSYGGDGVGVLNTLVYSAKKRVLCEYCKAAEKDKKEIAEAAEKDKKEMDNIMSQFNAGMSKVSAELAQQTALEQENLRLQNELLKQQLKNETMSRANSITSNENKTVPDVKRTANFCSGCGSALKQNARFCAKCGKRIG